jgi:DNA-binding NarL/FixJ family response regulator
MNTRSRIRVICVDDNPDLCDILSRVVRSQPDMECVASLPSADDLVNAVFDTNADVVVLDRTMPGKDPLQAVAELAVRKPECRAIVFTGWNDPEVMHDSRAAGAAEVLVKQGDPWAILPIIRRVAGR